MRRLYAIFGFDTEWQLILDSRLNSVTASTHLYCTVKQWIGWLVGCFGLNGPLRQYFSLYPAVSQREGEGKEK